MRRLVTLRDIDNIEPIKNADSIEVATIGGWKVVVKKGEFYVGQKVFYFEIDSLIPLSRGYFEFLRSRGVIEKDGKEYHRLKTAKLRGQISQGLILPYSIFEINPNAKVDENGTPQAIDLEGNKCPPYLDPDDTCEEGLKIHDEKDGDYSEYFEVIKYEPEEKGNLKPFPSLIEKTDEERIQNLPNLLKDLNPEDFYASEKIDGQSLTIYIEKIEEGLHRGVCSRNYELEGNTPEYRKAEQTGFFKIIEEYLDSNKNANIVAFQGEMFGEKIQKNPLGVKGQKILLYTIQVNGVRLTPDEILKDNILKNLYTPEYWVPIRSEVKLSKDLDEMISMPDGMKTHVSGANKDAQIEGLVWRSKSKGELEYEEKLIKASFKCISAKYLLKHE